MMKNLIRRILKEEFYKKNLLESKRQKRGLLTESNVDTTENNLDFNTIYNKFWEPMLYKVCMKYTKDINKASDYCQDGFMKVLKNLDSYSQTGSLEGWISRIIRNNTIDQIRKEKKMKHHSSEEPDWGRIEVEDDPYVEDYSIEMIEDVLPQLSPQYRKVFELFYLEGLSHEKIAQRLGISTGTSKSNLSKAKANLKKLLNV
jgi:RNA polymerase sigma-70 factor (ECF subfamily)